MSLILSLPGVSTRLASPLALLATLPTGRLQPLACSTCTTTSRPSRARPGARRKVRAARQAGRSHDGPLAFAARCWREGRCLFHDITPRCRIAFHLNSAFPKPLKKGTTWCVQHGRIFRTVGTRLTAMVQKLPARCLFLTQACRSSRHSRGRQFDTPHRRDSNYGLYS